MNDREPFADPSDPIDRTLSSAFRSRHVPPMSQPSMLDVRHRARRRQQRRMAGMVAAIVLVGASGVGVYALRHDDGGSRATLTPGDDASGAPASTVVCLDGATGSTVVLPSLTYPSTTIGVSTGTYIVQNGDIPAVVAQKFDLTVDELNAANAGLPGYDAFYVGLAITIPGSQTVEFMPSYVSTTTFTGQEPAVCSPGSGFTWHCTDKVGVDEFGRDVFLSCEQDFATRLPSVVPTTVPGELIGTSTTIMFPPDTTAVEGNTTLAPIDPNATSTTNVEPQSTTTTQG